jgi:hypothetical protein
MKGLGVVALFRALQRGGPLMRKLFLLAALGLVSLFTGFGGETATARASYPLVGGFLTCDSKTATAFWPTGDTLYVLDVTRSQGRYCAVPAEDPVTTVQLHICTPPSPCCVGSTTIPNENFTIRGALASASLSLSIVPCDGVNHAVAAHWTGAGRLSHGVDFYPFEIMLYWSRPARAEATVDGVSLPAPSPNGVMLEQYLVARNVGSKWGRQ